MSDHYRFYELKDKVKSSAYLAASMVQQIGNTKSDKQLTKTDLANIAFSSSLNFFHNNTMFRPNLLGLYYAVSYEWVKRINENSYKFQHCYSTTSYGDSPSNMNKGYTETTTITKSEVAAKNTDLVCSNDGDERVCIECCYRKPDYSGYVFKKNNLGFFILNPVKKTGIDGMTNNFFFYQILITPKPGLFPVTK